MKTFVTEPEMHPESNKSPCKGTQPCALATLPGGTGDSASGPGDSEDEGPAGAGSAKNRKVSAEKKHSSCYVLDKGKKKSHGQGYQRGGRTCP